MVTMGDKVLVDTNVLLRANMVTMPEYVQCDAFLKDLWRQGNELWISGQIIREFLVQATHPNTLKTPLVIDEVLQKLEGITTVFLVADDTPLVRAQLLKLLATYPTRGKQIHDANLVATMRAYEIETLVTLNTDDLKRFDDTIKLLSPMF
jgi:predicted nucleic acid-binding protein